MISHPDRPESREQELTPNTEYIGQVPTIAVASIMTATSPSTGESSIGNGITPRRIAIEAVPATAPATVLRHLSSDPTLRFTIFL